MFVCVSRRQRDLVKLPSRAAPPLTWWVRAISDRVGVFADVYHKQNTLSQVEKQQLVSTPHLKVKS